MVAQRVIYTGNFRLFPADAAGRRVLALASALHLSNITVLLYPSLGMTPAGLMRFDKDIDYDKQVDGVVRFSLCNLLQEMHGPNQPNSIILYNPSNYVALAARIFAWFYGINAVLDITEWYEYRHLPSIRSKVEVIVRMNIIYKMFSRMIFISDFLSQFYRPEIGRIIPPLIDHEAPANSYRAFQPKGPLRIVYAGFPGRKDRVDLLIEWLSQVDLPFRVELILAGPNADQIAYPVARRSQFEIIALGPVDRQDVFRLYQECHLSAIIRDDARYEWAGFPTKSVEGWSFGVPVLVMSHSRFARVAREYGAAAVIDAAYPVASLEGLLKEVYFGHGYLDSMSEASVRLAADRHQIVSYVESMKEIVS